MRHASISLLSAQIFSEPEFCKIQANGFLLPRDDTLPYENLCFPSPPHFNADHNHFRNLKRTQLTQPIVLHSPILFPAITQPLSRISRPHDLLLSLSD